MNRGSAAEIGILGSLIVTIDGRAVSVGGPRPRALVTVLALESGAVVSTERLLEALWEGEENDRAVETLHVYVSRLRKALGGPASAAGSALRAAPGGYVLDLPVEAVDVRRFERLVDRGRARLAEGDPAGAVEALQAGVALWRGEPLADLGASADGLRARLGARRLAAEYDLATARLALGRAADAVPDLAALVRRHPFDERLVELLMTALYASGRQADALDAYTAAATRLDDELGVEPGPALRALRQRVLRQEVDVPVAVVPAEPSVTLPADSGAASEGSPSGAPSAPAVTPSALPRPPRPRLPLVGRVADLELALARLTDPDVRVLTLLGLGGTGKSRLAQEVAARWDPAQDVLVVPLAATTDPRDVLPQVCRAAGTLPAGGAGSAREAAVAVLGGRPLLLVLDNLEQLLDHPHTDEGLADLEALLDRLPDARLLCTSRTRTELAGEHVHVLGPLPVPPDPAPDATPDPQEVLRYDAVRLFRDRARAALPGFEVTDANAADVATVCRMLDGLPLAVELAAARVRVLPPSVMAGRARDRLGLLTGGPRSLPDRHRSIRAALDWSVDLLDDVERAVLARLSVFAGGWTPQAAQAVCAVPPGAARRDGIGPDEVLDVLSRLVDRSLVAADGSGRSWLLELVREYASGMFAALPDAERRATLEAHRAFYLAHAEQHADEYRGLSREGRAVVDVEAANFAAALRSAQEAGDGERLASLVIGLVDYWFYGAALRDLDRWLTAARGAALEPELLARMHLLASNVAFVLADFPESLAAMDRAQQVIAAAGLEVPALELRRQGILARIERFRGEREPARRRGEVAADQAVAAGLPGVALNLRLDAAELLHWTASSADAAAALAAVRVEADRLARYDVAALAAASSALVRAVDGDLGGVRADLDAALATAQRFDSAAVLADVRTAQAVVDLLAAEGPGGEGLGDVRGDVRGAERAADLLRRALQEHEAASQLVSVPETVGLLGAALVRLGNPSAGLRLVSAASAWMRGRGLTWSVIGAERVVAAAEATATALLPADAVTAARAAGEAAPFASPSAVESLGAGDVVTLGSVVRAS